MRTLRGRVAPGNWRVRGMASEGPWLSVWAAPMSGPGTPQPASRGCPLAEVKPPYKRPVKRLDERRLIADRVRSPTSALCCSSSENAIRRTDRFGDYRMAVVGQTESARRRGRSSLIITSRP